MQERFLKKMIGGLFLLLFLIAFSQPSNAKKVKSPKGGKAPQSIQAAKAAPATKASPASPSQSGLHCEAEAAVLVDGLTGQVLYEQNPDLQIAPASFVKILTLYLVYDAIRSGQLKMDDMVTVSEKAWRTQGSKMFLKVGDRVKVEDLIKGTAIVSGNDACIAIAEHVAGTEEVFVTKMNEKAKLIGMKRSQFKNADGMPAEGQYTTAMDMAILSRSYIEAYPESMTVHSTTEYEYNGIRQGNRNILLQKNIGVDGLKTGHIGESGYHLVATAKRDGQRMIAVVMGCDKVKKRAPEAQKLLEYGFKNFSTVEAVKKGTVFGPVKVRRGKANEVALAAAEDVRVTVARGKEKSVSVVPQLPASVEAPIQKGQILAKALVQNEGKAVKEVTLIASIPVEKSLLPPWPIMVAIVAGLFMLALAALWWIRRSRARYPR